MPAIDGPAVIAPVGCVAPHFALVATSQGVADGAPLLDGDRRGHANEHAIGLLLDSEIRRGDAAIGGQPCYDHNQNEGDEQAMSVHSRKSLLALRV